MTTTDGGAGERGSRRTLDRGLLAWCRHVLAASEHEPARHHLAIIAALEQLERGETRRLMLLLPPGSAKSTYASVLFPAWWLGRHPRDSIITACHTAGLAEHFGRRVRTMVNEHPDELGIRVCADARAAGRFVTDKGGEYFAIGVQGAVTGRRADLAVIDDPVRSFAHAESTQIRGQLWEWFRSDLVTRMKPGGRIMLAMTRWHVDDLAGRLIEQGGWTVLRLPALAEPGDTLGRAPGEALWPEWEDCEELLEKRDMLGERAFSALFQQTPLRGQGMVFDTGKIAVLDAVPAGIAVRAWDLAATEAGRGDPDWTVGLRLLRDRDGSFVVEDVIRMRGGPAEVADLVRRAAERDGEEVAIGLPQDPGQAGTAQVLYLARMLAGYRVTATPERGPKPTRAAAVATQVAVGNLGIRRAPWNTEFLDELGLFPNGRKDDQVDALARAFAMLAEHRGPARFVSMPMTGR